MSAHKVPPSSPFERERTRPASPPPAVPFRAWEAPAPAPAMKSLPGASSSIVAPDGTVVKEERKVANVSHMWERIQ